MYWDILNNHIAMMLFNVVVIVNMVIYIIVIVLKVMVIVMLVLVIDLVVLDHVRNLFFNDIMTVVMERLLSMMRLPDHMILVLVGVLVVLSDGGVGTDHLWIVTNVRGRVVRSRLCRVVLMLMIDDWLMIDAIMMVHIVMIVIQMRIVMVHLVAMVDLVVVMTGKSVLDLMMMLLIMVLKAKVLLVMIVFPTESVKLWTVMLVMVIRVHILHDSLMVVNLMRVMTLVRILIVEVLLFRHILNHHIMMVIFSSMFQEVLCFSGSWLLGRSRCLGLRFLSLRGLRDLLWLLMRLKLLLNFTYSKKVTDSGGLMPVNKRIIFVKVSMGVLRAFSMVLWIRLVHHTIFVLVSLIESMRHELRWLLS